MRRADRQIEDLRRVRRQRHAPHGGRNQPPVAPKQRAPADRQPPREHEAAVRERERVFSRRRDRAEIGFEPPPPRLRRDDRLNDRRRRRAVRANRGHGVAFAQLFNRARAGRRVNPRSRRKTAAFIMHSDACREKCMRRIHLQIIDRDAPCDALHALNRLRRQAVAPVKRHDSVADAQAADGLEYAVADEKRVIRRDAQPRLICRDNHIFIGLLRENALDRRRNDRAVFFKRHQFVADARPLNRHARAVAPQNRRLRQKAAFVMREDAAREIRAARDD